jgi:hypothetical protein
VEIGRDRAYEYELDAGRACDIFHEAIVRRVGHRGRERDYDSDIATARPCRGWIGGRRAARGGRKGNRAKYGDPSRS